RDGSCVLDEKHRDDTLPKDEERQWAVMLLDCPCLVAFGMLEWDAFAGRAVLDLTVRYPMSGAGTHHYSPTSSLVDHLTVLTSGLDTVASELSCRLHSAQNT